MQERYGRPLGLLARRREELRELIAERRAALDRHAAGVDSVEDAVDTAFHRSSAELESGILERHLREVAAIDAAEARAAAGIFGICAGCMLPIDESRLEANPIALRCVACQRQFEKAPARLTG